MAELKEPGSLSEPIWNPIDTAAVDDSALTSVELHQNRMEWDNVIDDQLTWWGINPSQLEDDGIDAPSREIIGLACRVAYAMRDGDTPPPLRVVPDGDGGIVFERKDGPTFQTIEIAKDGSIEMFTFENSRLVSRQRVL